MREQNSIFRSKLKWLSFETAPKDGATFWIRQGELAPSTAYYDEHGQLKHIDFEHTNRPTQWAKKES